MGAGFRWGRALGPPSSARAFLELVENRFVGGRLVEVLANQVAQVGLQPGRQPAARLDVVEQVVDGSAHLA